MSSIRSDGASVKSSHSRSQRPLPTDERIATAILRSVAVGGESPTNKLWELVRRLKAYPNLVIGKALSRQIVLAWNSRNWKPAEDKALAAHLRSFRSAWRRATTPLKMSDVLVETARKVKSLPFDDVWLAQGRQRWSLLARLCWVLSQKARGKPFPLSVRVAADVMGSGFTDARKALKAMQSSGLIALVQRGQSGTKRRKKTKHLVASTWRWAGTQPEMRD
jgi:hypothetical protein